MFSCSKCFGCSKGLLKLILVSFLVFAWLLHPMATHCGILTVRSNHDTSSARSALRAIQDGRRGNFKRAIGPIFGSRYSLFHCGGGVLIYLCFDIFLCFDILLWRWCFDIFQRISYCTPCSFLGKIKHGSNMAKRHHATTMASYYPMT